MKKRHVLSLILFMSICLAGVAGLGAGGYVIYEYGDPSNGQSNKGPVLYLPDTSKGLSIVPSLAAEANSLPAPADFEALLNQQAEQSELGLVVEVSRYTHEISPYIYGINFSNIELIEELNIPLRRWGGNATTRYNWKTDVSNRASDWFFQNVPNPVDDLSQLPENSAANRFMGETLGLKSQPILTIPMIGWTPRGRDDLCGFPVSLYGQQQFTNPTIPDCGNGVLLNGDFVTGNDPNVSSDPIGPPDVIEWITHLQQQHGTAADGGIQFYALDNEPMLWHETHRDVHPGYVDYAEIKKLSIEYGQAIKDADPDAKTLGPVAWGWTAFLYSARDIEDGSGAFDNPDRDQYGNQPFVQWYLEQMRQHEEQTGTRILDYLDLHYYSQIDTVSLSEAIDSESQRLRLNATRSLWDPVYRDESWINKPIMLIPQMHEWIEESYPGTGTALTEYNFGALNHITGAIVQADALGIFGRERLDLATLWDPPTINQPGAYAFRMYRNYDGDGSTFGDLSLPAGSVDQNRVAIYAARRQADGAITIMLINKSKVSEPVTLDLTGESLAGREVERYLYSAVRPVEIDQLENATIANNQLNIALEPESIQLLVIN